MSDEAQSRSRKHTRFKFSLDLAVSIAIIIACGVIAVDGIWVFTQKSPRTASKHVVTVGQKLAIEGVRWSDGRETVLMALSTTCHFCNDSYPFYRELAQRAALSHDRLIAVFPQEVPVAKEHLDREQLGSLPVLRGPLFGVDIAGTPTLLLVDSNGIVKKVWVGKLSRDEQKDVFKSL